MQYRYIKVSALSQFILSIVVDPNTLTSDDVQEICLSLDPDLSFFSNTDLHLIFKFIYFYVSRKEKI